MASAASTGQAFDPLDMNNYNLDRLPDIKGGKWSDRFKFAGMPLAIFSICTMPWAGACQ